jgi:methyl-accepting chemotaxis protein
MREELNEKFRDARFNLYAQKLSDLMRDGISDDPKTVNAFNLLVNLIVEGYRTSKTNFDNAEDSIKTMQKMTEGMEYMKDNILEHRQAIEEMNQTIRRLEKENDSLKDRINEKELNLFKKKLNK